MKIEIEISDDIIRAALEETVIKQVREVLRGWPIPDEVKRMVKERWPEVVGAMIDDQVADHEGIRKQIADEMARKLRLQVAAALKIATAT